MEYINLLKYGLNEQLLNEAHQFPNYELARIIRQNRNMYDIMTENGERRATVSGKLLYNASEANSFPAVGDWIVVSNIHSSNDTAIIHHILTRKTVFERKSAGTSRENQIVASNIDKVFLCMSLNQDFNVRRIERYLTIAWDSGAIPIIVLTKADLCENIDPYLEQLNAISAFTDVVVCSSINDEGLNPLSRFLQQGETIAFIGSSGVGKSTLINQLAEQQLFLTSDVRAGDDRGRHTTTYRELVLLSNGTIVIDTPGMREIQLSEGNLSLAFEDIEQLISECKFNDCSHTREPGCAIITAIDAGELDQSRFDSYKNLQVELAYSGLSTRQIEHKKLISMFGGKDQFKRTRDFNKNKKK